jgi:hypothetical protein
MALPLYLLAMPALTANRNDGVVPLITQVQRHHVSVIGPTTESA